jgi:N-methylhydantoinase B
MSDTTRPVDPITLAVVRNYLNATATEMRDTIQRTSFSPVIYEDRDFACGLLDARGGTLAEAPGLTLFMGTLSPGVTRALGVIGRETLAPGDIFIVSLPSFTGSHPADLMVFAPIFHRDTLFGFAGSKAHLIDVGAKDPYPTDSTDAFQEGLRIPPVRLYRAGVLDEQIASVLRSNSRAPESIWGDIQSEIAAIRVGQNACQRLCDKYGFEVVTACVDEIYAHSERLARASIRQMPGGTWRAVEYCDDNGVAPGIPVEVVCDITVDPDAGRIVFDFSASAPQQAGPMNTPVISTISLARMYGKILSAPHTTANEGSFRPIEVIAPPGSIFNPGETAPTNLYGWPLLSCSEGIAHTLGQVFPDKLPAQSGGDLMGVMRFGFWPGTGKMWVNANIEGVGMGASSSADGESAMVLIAEACSQNLPVEIEETKSPVHVHRYELIQDSAGAGAFRGGLGVRRDYEYELDGMYLSALERTTRPALGSAGGGTATANCAYIGHPGEEPVAIGKRPMTPLPAGSTISVRSGGGGGWGDPATRDPEAVLRDVRDGYVSIAAARDSYGVAIDPATMTIDEAETARLRA